jgi:FkbM family methyltransferase
MLYKVLFNVNNLFWPVDHPLSVLCVYYVNMDYRHDIRFAIARFINRTLFLYPFSKSIPMQYFITKRLLPTPTLPVVVPTKDGTLLRLDIHTDAGDKLQGSVDRNLYYLGTYEIATTEVIRKYLKPDGIFMDVGSHNGSVALYASRIAKSGRILAFEPVLALYERVLENIALNHTENVKPLRVALGAQTGKLTMHVNHSNRGSSSLQKNSAEVYAEEEEVSIDTLDNQFRKSGLARVDMIKIDVEGFELAVLQGAETTIREYKPILIIEHDPKNQDVSGPFDFITRLGFYKIYIPKNGRHIKGPLIEITSYEDMPKNYVTNFVCVPVDL